MAFTLTTSNGTQTRYEDDARYALRENGSLVVQVEGMRRIYSPAAWSWIEDEGEGQMSHLEW